MKIDHHPKNIGSEQLAEGKKINFSNNTIEVSTETRPRTTGAMPTWLEDFLTSAQSTFKDLYTRTVSYIDTAIQNLRGKEWTVHMNFPAGLREKIEKAIIGSIELPETINALQKLNEKTTELELGDESETKNALKKKINEKTTELDLGGGLNVRLSNQFIQDIFRTNFYTIDEHGKQQPLSLMSKIDFMAAPPSNMTEKAIKAQIINDFLGFLGYKECKPEDNAQLTRNQIAINDLQKLSFVANQLIDGATHTSLLDNDYAPLKDGKKIFRVGKNKGDPDIILSRRGNEILTTCKTTNDPNVSFKSLQTIADNSGNTESMQIDPERSNFHCEITLSLNLETNKIKVESGKWDSKIYRKAETNSHPTV